MTITAPSVSADTYAGGRFIHDADAHMLEPDGFYERYADHAVALARRVVYIVTGRMPSPLVP